MMNPGGANGVAGIIDSSIFNMQGGLGIGSSGNEGQAIEKMILTLKEKVLNGETLNHFKKEIAQISILIDKCENQQMFEKSVYYLAAILQKPEREISLMLKRNCLQDKKKKKKADVDRKRQTITSLIEKELKEANTPKMSNQKGTVQSGADPMAFIDNTDAIVAISLDQLEPL